MSNVGQGAATVRNDNSVAAKKNKKCILHIKNSSII